MLGAMDLVPSAGFDSTTSKSLYIGNLHHFVNEQMLHEIFQTLGAVQETKLIKVSLSGNVMGTRMHAD